MHVLITGGNGYIGSNLVSMALSRGWDVTLLGRTPPEGLNNKVHFVQWSLNQDIPEAAFSKAIGAVIHLAHAWDSRGELEEDVNFTGSKALLLAAQRHGVLRIIYGSSLAAREKALNHYGRLKWRIEQLFVNPGEISARIGLVYGGPQIAMWGTLCKISGLLPLLPMVTPWRHAQPVHRDDLCEGLLRIASSKFLSRNVYGLGSPEPIAFGNLLRLLATTLHRKSLFIIPFPLGVILLALNILNRLPFIPTIDRERVLGLAGVQFVPCRDDLQELGVSLRPLERGLFEESGKLKRYLAQEGRALLRYTTSKLASNRATILYVRTVLSSDSPWPMTISSSILSCPLLLRSVEPLGHPRTQQAELFTKRLQIASMIADATDGQDNSIYIYHPVHKINVLSRLIVIGIVEACFLPLRMILSRLFWS